MNCQVKGCGKPTKQGRKEYQFKDERNKTISGLVILTPLCKKHLNQVSDSNMNNNKAIELSKVQ